MANETTSFERAMKLAVVCGLRTMLGPALVSHVQGRPERHNLAAAAMGEMVLDKLPFMPSRASLPLLIPRAMAGAWVAKTVTDEEGDTNVWAMPLGAAVAAGVAALAPRLRGILRVGLGVPGPLLGLAEDYLALRLGSEAVGLSMDDVKGIAGTTFDEVKGNVMPAIDDLTSKYLPAGHSA